MSAKSRAKNPIELPLRRGDYVTSMTPIESRLLICTAKGRAFVATRVANYKRRFKVHELTLS